MAAGPGSTSDAAGNRPERGGNFTFLDQALWKQFRDAKSVDAFASAWLALQCRIIGDPGAAVVLLGEPDQGPFAPAAWWPDADSCSPDLPATAELALAERRGIVRGEDDSGSAQTVAHPLFIDDHLFGVVAVEVGAASSGRLRGVMRQLQWGSGWLELLYRREQSESDAEQRERIDAAFDLIATALEHEGFRPACNAVVTELATRLDCDQASIGFLRRRRTVVAAVSHVSQFGGRMSLVRDIATAMDEAIDQEAVVVHPPREEWDYRITRAHAELARVHQAGAVLTVPLHAGGRILGALTLQRPHEQGFDEATVELVDTVAAVVGPMLEEKRLNDRWIGAKIAESLATQLRRLLGPHYFGRKLAALAILAVAVFFATATGQYRVTSPAVLEGEIQRAVVAPFEGYLASQHARAGEIVEAGELLATLDQEDLVLERLRWSTERRQRLAEYDRALAEGARAEAKIHQAQIAQAEAQVTLLDAQLERTRITAPFDGIVVEGDLSQEIGGALERGQELFRIAPLDAYRVILEVDEGDIEDVREEQTGTLIVASMPEQPLEFTVERITPISEQADGRNFFRVEARLHEINPRLRPGMEGVAKTRVEERRLIRIWTQKLVDWLRLTAWEWLP